jgi:Spy/CpxP family protein refolding chaperone
MKMTNKNAKTKKIVLWLLIGASVAATAAACGIHGNGISEKMMRRMVLGHVDDLMDEIDADDAQRATFNTLAEGIVEEALAMKKSHKAKEKTLLASLQRGTVDREALHTQLENHMDTAEDFLSRSLDKVLDAYETLRPAQKQIILDKLAEHVKNN